MVSRCKDIIIMFLYCKDLHSQLFIGSIGSIRDRVFLSYL